MSLWVDKHRPKKLSKLDYHVEQAEHLTRLVQGGDFPHLLISGPNGAGKKTRVVALLRYVLTRLLEKCKYVSKSRCLGSCTAPVWSG